MTKVLFVGNSYTYENDLPVLVAGLAASAGRLLDARHVTSGGKTLEWHTENAETLAALQESKWDVVVLQEHSIRPVQDTPKMLEAARTLQSKIEPTGARTVMYMTWARQHFPEMQPGLARVYTRVAQEIGADVAPVGLAWEAALTTDPMLVLHTSDKSHPNAAGSYLAACVFYATFFDARPSGLAAKIDGVDGKSLVDLPVAQALFLQKIAWDAVSNYRRDLATGVYDSASCMLGS